MRCIDSWVNVFEDERRQLKVGAAISFSTAPSLFDNISTSTQARSSTGMNDC